MAGRALYTLRLRFALILPALAALGMAGLLGWFWTKDLLYAAAAEHLGGDLPVLARLLAPGLDDEPERLHERIRRLARSSPVRLTVVRGDGVVVADSSRTWSEVEAMDNHGGRPEIQGAFARGRGVAVRFSDTLGTDFAYAAMPVTTPEGRLFALRMAVPLTGLAELRRRLVRIILLTAILAVAALALASWWLNRRLFRPLSELIATAGRLARGDLDSPLEPPREAELASLARSLNRMAEEHQRQLAALEAERGHLYSVLASMSDGVVVTDPQGRVETMNQVCRRWFGIEAEVRGRTILELTRQPALDDALAATLATGRGGALELALPGPDERTLAVSVSPLSDGSGAVATLRDLTAEQRLARVRRDLVANLSHELKTPLTAIRGSAETLADGALADSEAAPGFLGRILAQCDRLQLLLDDLLELARLERPEAASGFAAVDLGRIVTEALEAASAAAAAAEVTIESRIEPLPEIRGDASSLTALVSNLLDNAVRYNRPGGRVTVRLTASDGDALLEVEDTGIGIPLADQPRVFERFYRGDRSRSSGGSGLGLAIVKHAAELHRGTVELTSRPGHGTTFTTRLPLE